jgi:hypothetical protein
VVTEIQFSNPPAKFHFVVGLFNLHYVDIKLLAQDLCNCKCFLSSLHSCFYYFTQLSEHSPLFPNILFLHIYLKLVPLETVNADLVTSANGHKVESKV